MRESKGSMVWFRGLGACFLLIVFIAGCGREQAQIPLPTLISVTPTNATQGQTQAVTLLGTNFTSGSTIAVSGTGVTVSNTQVVDSGTITAIFAIASGATTGAHNVTVTTPGGTTNAQIFTVNLLQPMITITNPRAGATAVQINRTINVTFNKPMDGTTLTTGTFSATCGAPVAGTVTYNAASNTATFTPTSNLPVSTTCTVTLTVGVKDTFGNPLTAGGAPLSFTFTTGTTTDTTAPTLNSTDPANGATTVPTNKLITATFSEPMNPATITSTTFVVTGPGATAVPGTVSYVAGSNTAVFTPTSPLAASTLFTATVTTGSRDTAGNALVAPGGLAPDPWTFTTGTTADTNAPTVTVTVPANAATGVGTNTAISATFSKPVDPATISTGTFTVTTGTTVVQGTVTYNPATRVATFTPSLPLASSSTFTATVTTGVRDFSGTPLAANKVTTFTTGTTAVGQTPVNLGAAANFAVIARASTAASGTDQVNGDVGLSPGLTQGIPAGQINGQAHISDGAAGAALTSLSAAFTDAAGRTGSLALAANLGGLTITPGLYKNVGAVTISGAGSANILTLDAQGDSNAVFIFQVGTTLTTGASAQIVLTGGAKASNVFWQVGTTATLGTSTIFKGNILAFNSITVGAGSVIEGRLFAGSTIDTTATVTINGSNVTIPAP